jgi:hypothetical protein
MVKIIEGYRVHHGLVRVVKGPLFRALTADEDEDEGAWAAARAFAISGSSLKCPQVCPVVSNGNVRRWCGG